MSAHIAIPSVADARRAARDKMEATGYARTIEQGVLGLFQQRRKWSPDAAAKRLGLDPYDVRPQFSRMTAARYDRLGNVIKPAYLRKTEETRKSFRGNKQHIYERLPDQLEMSEWWS